MSVDCEWSRDMAVAQVKRLHQLYAALKQAEAASQHPVLELVAKPDLEPALIEVFQTIETLEEELSLFTEGDVHELRHRRSLGEHQ